MQKSKKNYKKIVVGIIAVIILVIVVVYYNTDSENLIELQPVEEVISNTPKTWQGKDGKVTFDGIVNVPDVTELYKWTVIINNDVYQKEEETRQTFLQYFDNLDRREEVPVAGSAGGILDTICYSDEEEWEYTDSLEISKSGHLALSMQSDYFDNEAEGNKWLVVPGNAFLPYETNYFYRTDGSCMGNDEDEYTLYDGVNKSIRESMDELVSVMEGYHSLCPDISLVPDRVAVFRNPEENCYILTSHGLLTYEGVPVDDAGLVEQQEEYDVKICRLDTSIWGLSLCGDKQPYMTILDYAYSCDEKLETYKEIITFEQAWDCLTDELPKTEDTTIQRADLMYSVWYEPEDSKNSDWTLALDEVPKMYATPVWRFVSYRDAQYSYAYYVDAVTGEVSIYHHACCR